MTLKMIDQPLVEVKHIKETARITTFHLVLNWVQHQRQLLALVIAPIIHRWLQPNRKNTQSVIFNTDVPHYTTCYYHPHTANDNSIMGTTSKRHDYGLMTEGWNLQPNNLDNL